MTTMTAASSLSDPGPAERYGLVLDEGHPGDPRVLADVEDPRLEQEGDRGGGDTFGVAMALLLLAGFTILATRLADWLTL